ncbi:MAG: hypothetical protein BGO67_08710 [Alphaproteobacteria bacterium 41-28]|nr:MAG: hypothetical protein BGO67_08710 [Alphaproteobacteria bacterium 41-28]
MNLKQIIKYILLTYVWLSPLYGQKIGKSDGNKPALYYADGQTYDRELGILILKGNVEFEHEGSVLEADYVTYNENTDIVTASGNVRLRQADGDINFAEYVELTGDMKKGIVLQLRTLMEDNSKIAALEGRKFEDCEELDQVVYTPCEFCGDKPPTWQINARRAVKDDVNKNIYFTDAQMRILDFPVLYTPYATQPLERRSGFLIPQPNYNSTLGASLEVPYYLALSKDIDMTLSPTFFTQKNPLFEGQYRQAFGNGVLKLDGGITDYKKSHKDKKAEKKQDFKIPKTRGYFLGSAKFNFNSIWRTNISGGVVSDKTFFRKYGYSGWKNEPKLTSKGILEGFLNQRDYAAAKVYHFQGLRNNDKQKHISSPLPYLEYNAFSAVDPWGGRFNFNGNLLNLYRKSGINYQRGIGEMGWQRPWVANFGQVFTVFASTRGDLYSVQHSRQDHDLREKEKAERMVHFGEERRHFIKKRGGARFFPQTGLNWRWPFINSFCNQSVVLQPVGQMIAAPDTPIGVKSRRIPDEDSTDFSFNDANLFSRDRFPGYDLIDTGSRAVYGGELLTTGDLFGDVEVFLGQSYSLSKPKRHDKSQGFGRRPSDYVGRIEASPFSWLTLNYRFRLDQKSLSPRVSEVGGSIGPDIAKLSGDYVFISKHAGTPDKRNFNQITLNLSSKITKYWTLVGILRQDLNKKKRVRGSDKEVGGGPLERGAGIIYRDDCFALGLTIKRQYYKDRDLRPATIAVVTLFLKNIGEFNQPFNIDQGLFGERAAKDLTP